MAKTRRPLHARGTPFDVEAGPYAVLLSPAQRRRFFGRRTPKKIACGTAACVYEGPSPGTVVKVTSDASDAQLLVRAQPCADAVPVVRDAVRLREPGTLKVDAAREDPFAAHLPPRALVHVVVAERLKAPPVDEQRGATWAWARLRDVAATLPAAATDAELVTALVQDRGTCEEGCRRGIRRFVRAARSVQRCLPAWRGDAHPSNLGLDARGRMKILDLGQHRDDPSAPPLPELAGAQRRRQKSRR